jgi:hypothetical protein
MSDTEIRAKIAAFNIDLDAVLNVLATKHGLDKLARGRCTFSENGFEMKLSATFEGGDTKEMAKLRANAVLYNLKDEVCGAVIKYANEDYELIGMKQTNMVLRKGNATFNAPINHVVASIRKHHPDMII